MVRVRLCQKILRQTRFFHSKDEGYNENNRDPGTLEWMWTVQAGGPLRLVQSGTFAQLIPTQTLDRND
jgi:hypothetical protein